MTVIARRIRATPYRSASKAWSVIVDLLAPAGENAARRELEAIAGIAAELIADETMTAPIVVTGSGPRVRLYCLYDDDAISGEDANENRLAFDATSGDWHVLLPCPSADLTWVRTALAAHSQRTSVRDMFEAVGSEDDDKAARTQAEVVVDPEDFFRT